MEDINNTQAKGCSKAVKRIIHVLWILLILLLVYCLFHAYSNEFRGRRNNARRIHIEDAIRPALEIWAINFEP